MPHPLNTRFAMHYASTHRYTILNDQQLPAGLAINAASVVGISFGKLMDNLVGTYLRKPRYPRVFALLVPFRNAMTAVPLGSLEQIVETGHTRYSNLHCGAVILGSDSWNLTLRQIE